MASCLRAAGAVRSAGVCSTSFPACGSSSPSRAAAAASLGSSSSSSICCLRPLARSHHKHSPNAARASGRRPLVARAMLDNGGNNRDVGDRLIASLPYLLPLLDAIPFGKFIFVQYPFVARAMAPLGPLAALYNGFPFLPFIVFLAIYSGIVNNPNLSRFVRYNAMQAVLLDILLIIPQVILGGVFKVPQDEFGFQMFVSAYNTIFLFMVVSSVYGMGSCLVGQAARLPLVGEAADTQVR